MAGMPEPQSEPEPQTEAETKQRYTQIEIEIGAESEPVLNSGAGETCAKFQIIVGETQLKRHMFVAYGAIAFTLSENTRNSHLVF